MIKKSITRISNRKVKRIKVEIKIFNRSFKKLSDYKGENKQKSGKKMYKKNRYV